MSESIGETKGYNEALEYARYYKLANDYRARSPLENSYELEELFTKFYDTPVTPAPEIKIEKPTVNRAGFKYLQEIHEELERSPSVLKSAIDTALEFSRSFGAAHNEEALRDAIHGLADELLKKSCSPSALHMPGQPCEAASAEEITQSKTTVCEGGSMTVETSLSRHFHHTNGIKKAGGRAETTVESNTIPLIDLTGVGSERSSLSDDTPPIRAESPRKEKQDIPITIDDEILQGNHCDEEDGFVFGSPSFDPMDLFANRPKFAVAEAGSDKTCGTDRCHRPQSLRPTHISELQGIKCRSQNYQEPPETFFNDQLSEMAFLHGLDSKADPKTVLLSKPTPRVNSDQTKMPRLIEQYQDPLSSRGLSQTMESDVTRRPPKMVFSHAVIQDRSLMRDLRRFMSLENMVERELFSNIVEVEASSNMKVSSNVEVQDCDIVLSPGTGLLLTTLQKLRQKGIPGSAVSTHYIQGRIEEVARMYNTIIVLISQNLPEGNNYAPLTNSDESQISAFERFARSSDFIEEGIKIQPILVPGGRLDLAKKVSSIACKTTFDHVIVLKQDESHEEAKLRKLGLNTFAAQFVLQDLSCGDATTEEVTLRLALPEKKEMVRRYSTAFGGAGLVSRVYKILKAHTTKG